MLEKSIQYIQLSPSDALIKELLKSVTNPPDRRTFLSL